MAKNEPQWIDGVVDLDCRTAKDGNVYLIPMNDQVDVEAGDRVQFIKREFRRKAYARMLLLRP